MTKSITSLTLKAPTRPTGAVGDFLREAFEVPGDATLHIGPAEDGAWALSLWWETPTETAAGDYRTDGS